MPLSAERERKMTTDERIEALSKQVDMLRSALIGIAAGRPISMDTLGNIHVVAGTTTTGLICAPCHGSPYMHHYRMPSGLCACQDYSWAK